MTDLSHWDFVHSFTGREAAALIVGIDPGNILASQKHLTEPVTRAIMASYLPPCHHPDSAREALATDDYGRWIFSVWLRHVIEADSTNETHQSWKKLGRLQFEEQYFLGHELQRWLTVNSFKSAYSFSHDQPETSPATSPCRWPWGTHHTELLGHLEAAARRYWGPNYDPADTSSASTNATVSEWLQTERKVSRTMADSIASILRPDGLPTGPRK